MKPYYERAGITIFHGDCRELIPQLPCIPGPDLVLTDPPYGAGLSFDYAERFQVSKRNPVKGGKWWANADRSSVGKHKPVIGDDAPFDPSHLLRFSRLVLFGAQFYASRLPDSGGWIVWDKRRGIEDAEWPMSEAELAWTNLGHKGIRIFRHRWFGLIRDTEKGEHYHPTQKPVALMEWIIKRWTPEGGYCSIPTVAQARSCLERSEAVDWRLVWISKNRIVKSLRPALNGNSIDNLSPPVELKHHVRDLLR